MLRDEVELALSPEKAIDFSVLADRIIRSAVGRIEYVACRAVRIHESTDGLVTGVEVEALSEGIRTRLVADRYVFACGCGLPGLVTESRGHPGALTLRQSYMLVLRHASLPLLSCIFPGDAAYGLFLVPRSTPEDTVWLLSNYSSFDGVGHRDADRLWLRQIVRTLKRFTHVLSLQGLQWGYYPAPKAEYRGGVSTLEGARVERMGWQNAVVAIPTKLTLVPDLVHRVVDWIAGGPSPEGHLLGLESMPAHLVERPTIVDETWRHCEWYGLDLLLAIDDPVDGPAEVPPWTVVPGQELNIGAAATTGLRTRS